MTPIQDVTSEISADLSTSLDQAGLYFFDPIQRRVFVIAIYKLHSLLLGQNFYT